MSVTINVIEGNRVTIQRQDPVEVTLQNVLANQVTIQQESSIAVTLQNTTPNQVNIQQVNNVGVTLQNIVPNAVTVSNGLSGGGTWGSITGTITDQTDLINYLNNLDLDGEKVVEALNTLKDGVKLNTYLQSESFESNSITMKGDGIRYTLPTMPEFLGYGYFMFTDDDGSLKFKQFPLGFLNNNVDVDVNGGTF